MLTREDNEILCRVGPGTPMGNVLRRYWHPFLLTEELLEKDGPYPFEKTGNPQTSKE